MSKSMSLDIGPIDIEALMSKSMSMGPISNGSCALYLCLYLSLFLCLHLHLHLHT